MATTYTHNRFAKMAEDKLDSRFKEAVHKYRDLYLIGSQGPDLLFYYKVLKDNPIKRQGNRIHERPAENLFSQAKESLDRAELDKAGQEIALAYGAGMLTHFLLDTGVHTYIEVKEEVSGVSHNKLEAEWDAYLMRLDGVKDPAYFDRSDLIVPQDKNIYSIVGQFYKRSADKIKDCIKDQRRVLKVFASKGIKRKLIQGFLRKKMPKYADLFCENDQDPSCRDSNIRLTRIFSKQLGIVGKYSSELFDFMTGQGQLSSYFERTFSVWEPDLPISILPADEEWELASQEGLVLENPFSDENFEETH